MSKCEWISIIVGYSSLFYLKKILDNNINAYKYSNTMDRKNDADDKSPLSKVND
tara:strand:+ start:342 stop:503 length:162 start_codon:yes stop_codon:yes gene_type:complete